jgi:hypothetical protein
VSVKDEQDLRESLTNLMEGVTPRPAPVARAVRQGKGIRTRRWVSAAVVVAVVAAGAAIAPSLLRSQSPGPAQTGHHKLLHYKVTVQQPHGQVRAGAVVRGVTDGKPWAVVATGSASDTVHITGPVGLGTWFTGPGQATWPVNFESTSNNSFVDLVGTVSPKVASITLRLPNGERPRLVPVRWHGSRWIGVVLPASVPIVRATAYSSSGRVLAYSVPFQGTELNVWWRPGQAGPSRLTKSVGSGVVDGKTWRTTADFGPWGYCYVVADGADCQTTNRLEQPAPGKLMRMLECGGVGGGVTQGPFTGILAVAPEVGRVELKFTGGGSASYPSVAIGGGRSLGYAIPRGASVVRIVFYSLSGRVLGSTTGAALTC